MRFEFHVSRDSRDRYDFEHSLFQTDGNVVFADFLAARRFAQQINVKRDLAASPESAARPAQLNAMGLIDEALHLVCEQYRKQIKPGVMREALTFLGAQLDEDDVQDALEAFSEQFPPAAVYRGEISLGEYLVGETDGMSNREHALEEMLMLHLANENPGFAPFRQELFNDDALREDTLYLDMMSRLRGFFDEQPGFGPDGNSLIDLLGAPARAAPLSLTEQLRFIASKWTPFLGGLQIRALNSLDFVAEEDKALWTLARAPGGAAEPGGGGGGGTGPVASVPVFTPEAMAARERELGLAPAGASGAGAADSASAAMFLEPEAFTEDTDWMPNTVMIAKSTYVWLDQLSKKYGREIRTLDQIPDAELDQLAKWNFNALWLIGVWERSRASEQIKKIMGNPEAAASAYSLMDYAIARDLGGEAAMENLKARAWQRGIRLGSDMVPNHMGIDSAWVMEHPERFLSLDQSPYPNYTFGGPELSSDPHVSVKIEDGYWTRKDAAVVFQRTDLRDGATRYIYHGNDGTSMPWNDTAQLNYLDPAVREQVIQTIIEVAKRFPIIRFDAAMTLAKRHVQRLWFPEPGTGGAIPSRAGLGLTRDAFNQAMPKEFWREVVDRCAVEAPDTLLLAEAFWLMEGFFVRTLGMHRVYNSAFMVMLRDEQNAGYRSVIKNTIEFDTGVVNRYVNFINNPDEKTAVEQFGKGDKYFGVCTLMATLPGLPMFGHGQIEGFSEKYGMEYRRAYYDEKPDEGLITRHEREIFPLLKKRFVFADSKNFLLYDFYRPGGSVDENVFAYSNAAPKAGAHGEMEHGLVVYNNSFSETRGRIRMSAAYSVKAPELAEDATDEERAQAKGKSLVQRTLAEGLGLHADDSPRRYVIFHDLVRNLEYIRSSAELRDHGLEVSLHAYERYVFTDFREVLSTPVYDYARLAAELNGAGVPSVEEALGDLVNQAVLAPYRALVNPDVFHRLTTARVTAGARAIAGAGDMHDALLDEIEQKARALHAAVAQHSGAAMPAGDVATRGLDARLKANAGLHLGLSNILAEDEQFRAYDWAPIHAWMFTHGLGQDPDDARALIDRYRFGNAMRQAFRGMYMDEHWADRNVTLVKILTAHQAWWKPAIGAASTEAAADELLNALLKDPDARAFVKLNTFDGATYVNQEAFENLLTRLFLIATQQAGADAEIDGAEVVRRVNACSDVVAFLRRAAKASGYQVEKMAAGEQGENPGEGASG